MFISVDGIEFKDFGAVQNLFLIRFEKSLNLVSLQTSKIPEL